PIGGPNTLLDLELYRNELPDDAPPNYRVEATAEMALTDSEAKRPGAAANQREAAVPKSPLATGRKKKSTLKDQRCFRLRTASSKISMGCIAGISRPHVREAPGTAPRRSSSADTRRSSRR